MFRNNAGLETLPPEILLNIFEFTQQFSLQSMARLASTNLFFSNSLKVFLETRGPHYLLACVLLGNTQNVKTIISRHPNWLFDEAKINDPWGNKISTTPFIASLHLRDTSIWQAILPIIRSNDHYKEQAIAQSIQTFPDLSLYDNTAHYEHNSPNYSPLNFIFIDETQYEHSLELNHRYHDKNEELDDAMISTVKTGNTTDYVGPSVTKYKQYSAMLDSMFEMITTDPFTHNQPGPELQKFVDAFRKLKLNQIENTTEVLLLIKKATEKCYIEIKHHHPEATWNSRSKINFFWKEIISKLQHSLAPWLACSIMRKHFGRVALFPPAPLEAKELKKYYENTDKKNPIGWFNASVKNECDPSDFYYTVGTRRRHKTRVCVHKCISEIHENSEQALIAFYQNLSAPETWFETIKNYFLM